MKISISKQQLASMPAATFSGRIVVVDSPEGVEPAVQALKMAPIIGFDTETRPAFKKGQIHQVALLQLSADDVCYLFRLNKIGLPPAVKELLEDKGITKIGLSIHDDFRNLRKSYELEPEGFVELQEYASQWSISDRSLSKLYGILFGERLSKGQRLSNWEAEELAESQRHYAALDAYACIRIYRHLSAGLFDPALCSYKIEEEMQ